MTDLLASDLARIYPKPTPRVIAKARPALDSHAKNFIAMSPFCVLATSSSDGSVDASPRAAEVTSEIGLMLAIHLAVALAVVATLSACGIG